MDALFEYYLFYKPYKVMSQFSPEGDKQTLADYFKSLPKNVYPVGRLDYDSEGLLLLTNDKQLNHKLLHPLFIHEREYWVQVEGVPTSESVRQLCNGVTIKVDGRPYTCKPSVVRILQEPPILPERIPPIRYRKEIPTSWLSITIKEGKNRQVRKMTAAVNLPTLRLVRYRIGAVTLGDMQPGDIQRTDKGIKDLLFHKNIL